MKIDSIIRALGKGSSYADYDYPKWADSLGLFISFASVMLIPIFAAAQVIKVKEMG